MIKRISRYATSDGKLFDMSDQAIRHERKLMVTQELLSRRDELDLPLDQIDKTARIVCSTWFEVNSIFQQDLLPVAQDDGIEARRAALREALLVRTPLERHFGKTRHAQPHPADAKTPAVDFEEQLRNFWEIRDAINRHAQDPEMVAAAVTTVTNNVTVGYTGPKATKSAHEEDIDDALDDLEANLAAAFKPGSI
jgi:hypothetical protein